MKARALCHAAARQSFPRRERLPGRLVGLRSVAGIVVLGTLVVFFCGCTSPLEYIRNGFKVGPNYRRPPAPIERDWIDASDKRVRRGSDDLSQWWKVFNDPVLNKLICTAYQQNLTLREAGFRILEARAQLGIAIGNFFPQTQTMMGNYSRQAISLETANRNLNSTRTVSSLQRWFTQWDFGFTLAWELDFWGRFRRAIESAADSLDASVADYDDVVVTLLSDVATAYVNIRITEKRIVYAKKNAALQRESYEIAKAKKMGGVYTGLDVDQSLSTMKQTEATVPELEIMLRQFGNQLCILLGIPPEELRPVLGSADIPTTPPEVVIGIPADLLRRRPDIRRAERQAAAQCAQIGVAEAELYPHISIRGVIDYQSEKFRHLFNPKAFSGNITPGFQWDILNYGRLLNNVRFQDARFKELVAAYQQTVLTGYQETENGLVSFLRAQERKKLQLESVQAEREAVKTIRQLQKAGVADYTRVTQLLLNLVVLEDTLAQVEGEIALGLIQVYKGLGGGWEIRCTGCDPNSPTSPAMLPATEDAVPSKLPAPEDVLPAPRPEPQPSPNPEPGSKPTVQEAAANDQRPVRIPIKVR